MKRALLALAACVILIGQTVPEGTTTNQTGGTPNRAFQRLFYYDGSSNLQYICVALSVNPRTTLPTATAATLASPTVITSTGHGLDATTNPEIRITGATATWADINETWTATIIDANSFSVPFNASSGVSAFGAQAWTITTAAPRTTLAQWAIQRLTYTGTSLTGSHWAKLTTGPPSAYDKVCASKSSYGYQ